MRGGQPRKGKKKEGTKERRRKGGICPTTSRGGTLAPTRLLQDFRGPISPGVTFEKKKGTGPNIFAWPAGRGVL